MFPRDVEVAVLVICCPAAIALGAVKLKVPTPAAFVVTLTAPRKRSPSPNPLESQALLENSSTRKALFGVLRNVPPMVVPPAATAASSG